MTDTRCCGEHYPGEAGEQLILACQLCPRSPTYWRAAIQPTVSYETEEASDG